MDEGGKAGGWGNEALEGMSIGGVAHPVSLYAWGYDTIKLCMMEFALSLIQAWRSNLISTPTFSC